MIRNRLGILQGRLSLPVDNRVQAFPHGTWKDEFVLCQKMGLSCIEWIYEFDRVDKNPLNTNEGINAMLGVSMESNVTIPSVLADFFMERKLFGDDKREVAEAIERLEFLIDQCAKCQIPLIEIPFVDSSALISEEDRKTVVMNLKEPLAKAASYGIEIGLETDLPPADFKEFIQQFEAPNIKVNFDMGNSASVGFDPREEVTTLGLLIANVHIKDRVRNGGTVPLGDGSTDFTTVFKTLKNVVYSGDFILQGARQDLKGMDGCKTIEQTIKDYTGFVKSFLV